MIMGNITKIRMLINFGQKYTETELNDSLVIAMEI